ncbi:MAG TPA: lytic polysaccharide monooxygenase [Amycolatopsis sp.]|uniref:Lytic polysaccharide monooxygenase n=1 Tax=Amycolatopsis nalaikhensis TaxID=715472 RepID=A0ABY8XW09_9PSEU|nr:lytic polysaccharide monooxygenase [Amycolatopsis sp. 2-2]WIV59763.1 lytic polysaccharide monooxygenase [Amycolatopsis sp. 2-2]
MTWKRTLFAAAAGALLAPVLVVVLPATTASAHGYISDPPSRQANCAAGKVPNCGDIVYEPQSVEGPKGLRSCDGGNSRFSQLSDESKPWPAKSVGTTVTFNWVFTARHATSNYEYYIGGTRVANIPGNNQQPPSTVSHQVNLAGYSGRVKVLAIWNISDTANAFYSCVDLQIGGGTPPPTTTTPPPTTTRPPTTTPPPTTQPPSGGTWSAGTAYKAGDIVTYGGATYRCLQPHTAIAGWEPPNTPALWQRQ